MKRLLYILPILALIAASCTKDPYADARIAPNPAWVGEDVEFTNLSTNAKSVEWDFGDGTSSSMANVLHFYYDPGTYEVTLRAFGKKNNVNVARFMVDVDGSELEVVVMEKDTEYLIEGASVLLFASADDWYEGDYDKAVAEEFTNRFGECVFSGLSYQRYYVDVYYQVGNEGYVNWLLGEDDIGWVETQELPGGWDHTFIANVEFVEFTDKKGTGQMLRPDTRPRTMDLRSQTRKSATDRPVKENKFSVKKERK